MQKYFNGKLYIQEGKSHQTKTPALKAAEEIRKTGKLARVYRSAYQPHRYYVLSRNKQ